MGVREHKRSIWAAACVLGAFVLGAAVWTPALGAESLLACRLALAGSVALLLIGLELWRGDEDGA